MMLATLPDWMDADFLEAAAAVAIFVAVALAIFTVIAVRSLGTRVIIVLLLGVAAFGAFAYRESVEDCSKDCDCSFLGEDVPIEDCGTAAAAAIRP